MLGKTVCENYKTKSTRRTAPEEQFVFEGAIPAIIDEETWHNVQRLRETMRRTPKRSSGLFAWAICFRQSLTASS